MLVFVKACRHRNSVSIRQKGGLTINHVKLYRLSTRAQREANVSNRTYGTILQNNKRSHFITMAVYNAITGLKRKLPAYRLPRKKRSSNASTVASRMYTKRAQEIASLYVTQSSQYLAFFVLIHTQANGHMHRAALSSLCLLFAAHCYSSACRMLQLDSHLMDLGHEEQNEEHGYHTALVGMSLDSYANDDECVDKTRFKKQEIRLIEMSLQLPEYVKLYYYENNYYKFRVEELLIYVLRKLTTGRIHKDLTIEFGGCSSRWGRGYNWIIRHIDNTFTNVIGPRGMLHWVDQFPYFAEQIRQYVVRDKRRERNDGTVYYLNLGDHEIAEHTANIMSFIDCTFYEYCRPGSGPLHSEEASPRKPGWYPKQRAFYSAYQRGMEACVKILTICLPNGITAAVYGPTSGRRNDLTLFRLSDLDDHIMEICQESHGGDLYCTYGDGIFAGYWYCLRTKHVAPPGMVLTDAQLAENENYSSARISVEMSYAKAEQLFPMLNIKNQKKLEVDAIKSFAEIRVMYLFTNFKVCCAEGSTMTGERMFQCPPPSLEEYLGFLNN
jgi:DDE superfamily endonuclease